MGQIRIEAITAREIINGRGIPTVEAVVRCENGITGRAAAPSGISVSDHEAVDLKDGGSRYMGKGTRLAVSNINNILGPALSGMSVLEQELIDRRMVELDGTPNRSHLGGNAMIAVSVAVAKAAAAVSKLPLYAYLGGSRAVNIPVVCPNLISGSRTAGNHLDFEDFLVVPFGFDTFAESIRAVVEVFHILYRNLCRDFGLIAQITALAPPLHRNEDTFEYLSQAIKEAGYEGSIGFAVDVASGLIYNKESRLYEMEAGSVDREELIGYYAGLCEKYPLSFIEDGLQEDDYEGFAQMKKTLPSIIVGDDIFATNKVRLKKGYEKQAGNGIIIKANQAGTLTETLEVARMAHELGYTVIASTRSGETADEFQSDLAVAIGAAYMKTGCPFRGEMVTKWNRMMEIEQELGERAVFKGTCI